jgi:hypothetical protein
MKIWVHAIGAAQPSRAKRESTWMEQGDAAVASASVRRAQHAMRE